MKPGGTTSTSATASGRARCVEIAVAMSIGFRPVLRWIFSATEQA
jgi:hypothetical protein